MAKPLLRPSAPVSRARRRVVHNGLAGVALVALVGALGCANEDIDEAPQDASLKLDAARDATSDRAAPRADVAAPATDAADSAAASDVTDGAPGPTGDATADSARDAGAEAARDAAVDDARDAAPAPPVDGPRVDAAADVSAPLIDAALDRAPVIDAPAVVPDVIVTLPTRQLAVVAHPDDDVLFLNPDLDRAMQGGAVTRTVLLTSGDMGGDWQDRETRIKSAHAFMAGVASEWTCVNAPFAGKTVVTCTLPTFPRDSLLFIRLRDGVMNNLWVRSNNEPPFAGATYAASMVTIDNAQTYTRDDVVNVMRAIMADFAPTKTLTLDGSFAYGSDIEHRDHVVTALFAANAAEAYGHLESFTMYRGYTTSINAQHEPANLTTAEYNRKVAIMRVYDPPSVVAGSQYDLWCARQYPITNQLGDGTLRLGAKCMQASAAAAVGVDVVLAACTGAAAQRWSVRADGHIVEASGLCLSTTADASLTAELATCADLPAQKWLWLVNGQLHASDANCLTADGASVGLSAAVCGRNATEYGPWDQQVFVR